MLKKIRGAQKDQSVQRNRGVKRIRGVQSNQGYHKYNDTIHIVICPLIDNVLMKPVATTGGLTHGMYTWMVLIHTL